jgi:hypothetical protein
MDVLFNHEQNCTNIGVHQHHHALSSGKGLLAESVVERNYSEKNANHIGLEHINSFNGLGKVLSKSSNVETKENCLVELSVHSSCHCQENLSENNCTSKDLNSNLISSVESF